MFKGIFRKRVSLRAFFVAIGLFCALLALASAQASRNRAVVAKLRATGAIRMLDRQDRSWIPRWFREAIGRQNFTKITAVSFPEEIMTESMHTWLGESNVKASRVRYGTVWLYWPDGVNLDQVEELTSQIPADAIPIGVRERERLKNAYEDLLGESASSR